MMRAVALFAVLLLSPMPFAPQPDWEAAGQMAGPGGPGIGPGITRGSVTVLNEQSTTGVGQPWTIRFETTGSQADLTVSRSDGARLDAGLTFAGITGGATPATTSAGLVFGGWKGNGEITFTVNTAGDHSVRLSYGGGSDTARTTGVAAVGEPPAIDSSGVNTAVAGHGQATDPATGLAVATVILTLTFDRPVSSAPLDWASIGGTNLSDAAGLAAYSDPANYPAPALSNGGRTAVYAFAAEQHNEPPSQEARLFTGEVRFSATAISTAGVLGTVTHLDLPGVLSVDTELDTETRIEGSTTPGALWTIRVLADRPGVAYTLQTLNIGGADQAVVAEGAGPDAARSEYYWTFLPDRAGNQAAAVRLNFEAIAATPTGLLGYPGLDGVPLDQRIPPAPPPSVAAPHAAYFGPASGRSANVTVLVTAGEPSKFRVYGFGVAGYSGLIDDFAEYSAEPPLECSRAYCETSRLSDRLVLRGVARDSGTIGFDVSAVDAGGSESGRLTHAGNPVPVDLDPPRLAAPPEVSIERSASTTTVSVAARFHEPLAERPFADEVRHLNVTGDGGDYTNLLAQVNPVMRRTASGDGTEVTHSNEISATFFSGTPIDGLVRFQICVADAAGNEACYDEGGAAGGPEARAIELVPPVPTASIEPQRVPDLGSLVPGDNTDRVVRVSISTDKEARLAVPTPEVSNQHGGVRMLMTARDTSSTVPGSHVAPGSIICNPGGHFGLATERVCEYPVRHDGYPVFPLDVVDGSHNPFGGINAFSDSPYRTGTIDPNATVSISGRDVTITVNTPGRTQTETGISWDSITVGSTEYAGNLLANVKDDEAEHYEVTVRVSEGATGAVAFRATLNDTSGFLWYVLDTAVHRDPAHGEASARVTGDMYVGAAVDDPMAAIATTGSNVTITLSAAEPLSAGALASLAVRPPGGGDPVPVTPIPAGVAGSGGGRHHYAFTATDVPTEGTVEFRGTITDQQANVQQLTHVGATGQSAELDSTVSFIEITPSISDICNPFTCSVSIQVTSAEPIRAASVTAWTNDQSNPVPGFSFPARNPETTIIANGDAQGPGVFDFSLTLEDAHRNTLSGLDKDDATFILTVPFRAEEARVISGSELEVDFTWGVGTADKSAFSLSYDAGAGGIQQLPAPTSAPISGRTVTLGFDGSPLPTDGAVVDVAVSDDPALLISDVNGITIGPTEESAVRAADAAPPAFLNATLGGSGPYLLAVFDGALDTATVDAADFSVADRDGEPLAVDSVESPYNGDPSVVLITMERFFNVTEVGPSVTLQGAVSDASGNVYNGAADSVKRVVAPRELLSVGPYDFEDIVQPRDVLLDLSALPASGGAVAVPPAVNSTRGGISVILEPLTRLSGAEGAVLGIYHGGGPQARGGGVSAAVPTLQVDVGSRDRGYAEVDPPARITFDVSGFRNPSPYLTHTHGPDAGRTERIGDVCGERGVPALGSPGSVCYIRDERAQTLTVLAGHLTAFGVGERFLPSGGSDCTDCSAPTIGRSPSGAQLVSGGFSYNGRAVDAGRFHTEFPLVGTEVGRENVLRVKVHENYGPEHVKLVELAIGVPEVGGFHRAEAHVEVWLERQGTAVREVAVDDPRGLLEEGVEAYTSTASCAPGGEEGECLLVTVRYAHREAPLSGIIGVKPVDFRGYAHQFYFNDGVEVSGESLNEPARMEVSASHATWHPQKTGMLQLTEADRGAGLWVDGHGIYWEVDGHTVRQATVPGYEHPLDNPIGELHGMARNHPLFHTGVDAERLRAEGALALLLGNRTIHNQPPGAGPESPWADADPRGEAWFEGLVEAEALRASELAAVLYAGQGR